MERIGVDMVIHETLATPVLGEYDAVVVGAGPAGCGAALALGRSGLKTLLIEKFNCLGFLLCEVGTTIGPTSGLW